VSKGDLTAKDFLIHILESADRVQRYTKSMGHKEFSADTMVQDAVIRNMEIIGEAANNLLEAAPGIDEKYPSIPFIQIRGMRNRVAHGYFAVSLSMIWDSCRRTFRNCGSRLWLCSKKCKRRSEDGRARAAASRNPTEALGTSLSLHQSKGAAWNTQRKMYLGDAPSVPE